MTEKYNPAKTKLYNLLFILVSAGILIFLWLAPKETTPHLPHDDKHEAFFGMDKKEAESHCLPCHDAEGEYPLLENHPPKYRCLLCHKRKPKEEEKAG